MKRRTLIRIAVVLLLLAGAGKWAFEWWTLGQYRDRIRTRYAAAIEMIERLKELQVQGFPPIHIGIGIPLLRGPFAASG